MDFIELAQRTSVAQRRRGRVALVVAKNVWRGVPIACGRLSWMDIAAAERVLAHTGDLPKGRARTKHLAYAAYVHTNIFVSPRTRRQVLDIMCAAQRLRWTFVRAMMRRAAVLAKRPGGAAIDTDLSLVPLSQLPDRHIVTYHEGGKRYRFFIPDLLRHWRAQLGQQSWLVPEPAAPNNPYTREQFSYTAMMAVYVAARLQNFVVRGHVQMYVSAGCSIDELIRSAGHVLRDAATFTHALEGGAELYGDVLDIAESFPERMPNVCCVETVPQRVAERVVEVFRPALVQYFSMRYGASSEVREAGGHALMAALDQINEAHSGSGFGRVFMRRVRGGARWNSTWRV